MQVSIYVNAVRFKFWEVAKRAAYSRGMGLAAFVTRCVEKELDRMEAAGELPPRAADER